MSERVLAIVLILIVAAGSQPAQLVHRAMQAVLACFK
jgi:hypothetical protein